MTDEQRERSEEETEFLEESSLPKDPYVDYMFTEEKRETK